MRTKKKQPKLDPALLAVMQQSRLAGKAFGQGRQEQQHSQAAIRAAQSIQRRLEHLEKISPSQYDPSPLDTLQAKKLRKPMKHWLGMAHHLFIDSLVRASLNLDTRSLPARIARNRLRNLALAIDPAEVRKVLKERSDFQMGVVLVLESMTSSGPKRKKK